MTPEQRYLLDINGYLVLRDAVQPDALAAARAAAYRATEAGERWDVYSDPALSRLAFTPAAWPVVLELTRGQPMMRLGIGLHDAPRSGGGGMLHCNREAQRSSAVNSMSMASYSVLQDGTIFAVDFGMFVYLDSVQPGDGGLLMVNGSHKARFERPPSVGSTYGSGNFGLDQLGVRERGFTPTPHTVGEDGVSNPPPPPHTVNLAPQAGDIVIMSECVAHATMAWRGGGHRHVLRIGFKPQHVAHPEEDFSDDAILRLPPEIRELRSHAPLGHTKRIVEQMRVEGCVHLTAPDSTIMVTDAERTHGQPYHAGQVYAGTSPPPAAPAFPAVAGGMSAEQRYLFDIHGYCHLRQVLVGEELVACQAAAADYVNTPPASLPEGFAQTPGGKYLHSHAWAPCLERLAVHPGVWPTLMELLDGKPKLVGEAGTLFWESAARADELTSDSYDASRDVSTHVPTSCCLCAGFLLVSSLRCSAELRWMDAHADSRLRRRTRRRALALWSRGPLSVWTGIFRHRLRLL